MDSLSQIVLGAAVGESILGKKLGNRALLLGAIVGTLPDLDVLTNIFTKDEVLKLQIHRSYTHAFFFQFLFSVVSALMFTKWYKKNEIGFKRWFAFIFLGLATHSLLDCFTTYGTQVLLPFSDRLIGFNNISVVDPLYTVPFLICLILCMFFYKDDKRRQMWASIGWFMSIGYILTTLVIKSHVENIVDQELKRQSIEVESVSTSPTLFNSILWAAICSKDDTLYLGEYSILQKSKEIKWHKMPQNTNFSKGFEGEALNTLNWFSQGKQIFERLNDSTLNVYIAKWGRQDLSEVDINHTFRFFYSIIKNHNGQITMTSNQNFNKKELKPFLIQLYNRIFFY